MSKPGYNENDYLIMLVDALCYHKGYFAEHVIRLAEKAEKEGVLPDEFYRRLKNANAWLLEKLNERLHTHKGMSQVDKDGTEHPFTIEQMTISLLHLFPNNNYRGWLDISHINYVTKELNYLVLLNNSKLSDKKIQKQKQDKREELEDILLDNHVYLTTE